MRSLCVHCNDEHGEVVSRKRSSSDGVVFTLLCPACEGLWTVVL